MRYEYIFFLLAKESSAMTPYYRNIVHQEISDLSGFRKWYFSFALSFALSPCVCVSCVSTQYVCANEGEQNI